MATPIYWNNSFIVNIASDTPEKNPIVKVFSDGSFVVVWEDYFQEPHPYSSASGIAGRLFNADGSPRGPEFLINSTMEGYQKFPDMALLNDGRFVVTWEDASKADGEGDSWGIRAQIFNKDGTPYDRNGDGVGDPDFHVNTTVADGQFQPRVTALTDGGFVIAYHTELPGDQAILLQSYDPLGGKVGGEIRIVAGTSARESRPAVTGLKDGRFVVLWEGIGSSDDPFGLTSIHGRILTPGSDPTGLEFLVPSSRGTKADIAVTTLADGKFVVTWTHAAPWASGGSQETGADGSGLAIKAQMFNADGTMYRGEFIVNEVTLNDQKLPAVTALPDGGFAVAYVDLSTGEVLVRLAVFDAQGGRPSGDIFVGMPAGSTIGYKPSLSALADGRIVVTWENVGVGNTQGNDFASIRAQIIDPRSAAVNLAGTTENDEYYGTVYSDILRGGQGADKLSGDVGNDTLIGGIGADTLNGGRAGAVTATDGTDFASYADSNGVTANLLDAALNTGDAAGDVYISIEGLIGSSQADYLSGDNNANTLLGGGGNDQLFGNDGADLLKGEDGDDALDGGLGADILQGGKGNDSYTIDNALDDIDENAGEGYDTAITSVSFTLDSAAHVEELYAQAGSANINLTGNGIANKLFGNNGINELNGGAGADTLEGGLGNDTYVIDDLGDVVIEASGTNTGYDTVAIAAGFLIDGTYRVTDYANIEALTALDGAGKIDLVGSAIGNRLTGNSFDNILEGLGGNDTLDGGGGTNTAVFTGAKSQYVITKNADGTITVADTQTGRDGTDLLKNIKFAQFSDETVDLLLALPSLSISPQDAAKAEGDSNYVDYTFKVTRSSSSGASSVNWAVTGLGTQGAASADDFDASTLSGIINFLDGQSEQYITVKVKADKDIEGHETFSVTLSSPVAATLGTAVAAGTIINDDVLPALSIAATDAAKAEGSAGAYTSYNFLVTRSNGAGVSKATWTVKGVGANAAQDEDFLGLSGQVTFADGETSQVITVMIRVDDIPEGDETFSIVLSHPDGATIMTDTAYGTISNDDVLANAAPTSIRLTTGGTTVVVDENRAVGSLVGTVTANDDAGTAALRYFLATEDANFEIDELTGQIRIKTGANLNYEGVKTYTLSVKVRDLNGNGLESVQDITINLADVNEAPNLGSAVAAVTIGENATAGDTVASFTLDDADIGEEFIFEILGVPAAFAGAFAVDVANRKIVISDPSKLAVTNTQNFTLTLKVTDKKGGSGKPLRHPGFCRHRAGHSPQQHGSDEYSPGNGRGCGERQRKHGCGSDDCPCDGR